MENIKIDKRKGYDVSIAYGSEYYIPNALHIERIDELMMFEDDEQACIQAEKDGIRFIDDMDGVPKLVYIDTKENREIIKNMLVEYPEYYMN